VEFYGATVPVNWGEAGFPAFENNLKLRRKFGALGARIYNGANGDQVAVTRNAGDRDDSYDMYRDDDPQSDFTWTMSPYTGQTYESHGVFYDIDHPGASAADSDIWRARDNFVEWAEWDGHLCSWERPWSLAMSCKWDAATQTFDLVNDVQGDNTCQDGSLLPSVSWDLQ
jgi:hypothetical protein